MIQFKDEYEVTASDSERSNYYSGNEITDPNNLKEENAKIWSCRH